MSPVLWLTTPQAAGGNMKSAWDGPWMAVPDAAIDELQADAAQEIWSAIPSGLGVTTAWRNVDATPLPPLTRMPTPAVLGVVLSPAVPQSASL
jgi:hypothetical protein